jgi:hypothetical protein
MDISKQLKKELADPEPGEKLKMNNLSQPNRAATYNRSPG